MTKRLAYTMVDAPTFNVANSAYRTKVGRPKKYEDPWSTMNKRVYVLGTMLEKLRRVKEESGFSSDDEALQYLLQRHVQLLRIEQAGKT